MGLADVKRAIEQKTKAEVDAVLNDARKEAEHITEDAKEQVRASRETHGEQTKEFLSAMERREHAAAQFGRKTLLLEEKRKAVDAVFANVRTKLDAMGPSERATLLSTLSKKAASQSDSIATVRANSKDVAALKKTFSSATIIADDSILGGFLADDSTGTIRLDYTYDTILEAVAERSLSQLTELLFGRT